MQLYVIPVSPISCRYSSLSISASVDLAVVVDVLDEMRRRRLATRNGRRDGDTGACVVEDGLTVVAVREIDIYGIFLNLSL